MKKPYKQAPLLQKTTRRPASTFVQTALLRVLLPHTKERNRTIRLRQYITRKQEVISLRYYRRAPLALLKQANGVRPVDKQDQLDTPRQAIRQALVYK